jgi:hypothetical protein
MGEYKELKSTENANFATSSGRVGIGTDSPTAKLQIVGDTVTSKLKIGDSATTPANNVVNFNGLAADPAGNPGDLYYNSIDPGRFRYHSNQGWEDLTPKLQSATVQFPPPAASAVGASGSTATYTDYVFNFPKQNYFTQPPVVIVQLEPGSGGWRALDSWWTGGGYVWIKVTNVTNNGFTLSVSSTWVPAQWFLHYIASGQ